MGTVIRGLSCGCRAGGGWIGTESWDDRRHSSALACCTLSPSEKETERGNTLIRVSSVTYPSKYIYTLLSPARRRLSFCRLSEGTGT